MKKLVNLTPHEISLANAQGEIIETIPSTGYCRLATTQETVDNINGFPVNRTIYGSVEGLPEPPQEDTIFIVSLLVAQQVPNRSDVVAPDSGSSAIREGGQIKAVKGFVRA